MVTHLSRAQYYCYCRISHVGLTVKQIMFRQLFQVDFHTHFYLNTKYKSVYLNSSPKHHYFSIDYCCLVENTVLVILIYWSSVSLQLVLLQTHLMTMMKCCGL